MHNLDNVGYAFDHLGIVSRLSRRQFEHLQKKTGKVHLYNIPNQFGKVAKRYSLTRRESAVGNKPHGVGWRPKPVKSWRGE
jgi:hypothetical protein